MSNYAKTHSLPIRELPGAAMLLLCMLMLGGCVSSSPDRDSTNLKQASEANVRLAAGYLEEGKTEIALEKAMSAVSQDAENVQAQSVLAIIYEQLGQLDKAEQHYRQAIAINPENGDVRNNYGTFLCQRGRYDAAEENFRAAAQDPFYRTPEVALTNAGACARRRGDNTTAERLFREALGVRSDYAEALYHMASVSFDTEDYFRARAFLQRYESSGPAIPGSLLLGYRVESELADPEAAQNYRQRLMTQFPNSAEAQMVEVSDPDDRS